MISLPESLVDRSDTARLLTREEAADVLNVSVRKLDALEEAGKIQAIRIGRSVRYHPEVLDRFIRRQVEGSDR
jgi:excisionase family DNA binding protein